MARANAIKCNALLYNDKKIFILKSEEKNTIESENKARLAEIAPARYAYVWVCVYMVRCAVCLCACRDLSQTSFCLAMRYRVTCGTRGDEHLKAVSRPSTCIHILCLHSD